MLPTPCLADIQTDKGKNTQHVENWPACGHRLSLVCVGPQHNRTYIHTYIRTHTHMEEYKHINLPVWKVSGWNRGLSHSRSSLMDYYWFIHSFIHSFICSFIHSFVHSFEWLNQDIHVLELSICVNKIILPMMDNFDICLSGFTSFIFPSLWFMLYSCFLWLISFIHSSIYSIIKIHIHSVWLNEYYLYVNALYSALLLPVGESHAQEEEAVVAACGGDWLDHALPQPSTNQPPVAAAGGGGWQQQVCSGAQTQHGPAATGVRREDRSCP